MLVTWLGHAQLFINAAGKTLLLDPWFFEPVFGGAWFRYPPPPYPDSSSLPRPDFVCLSHIHPDHAGPRTLERLCRAAQRPPSKSSRAVRSSGSKNGTSARAASRKAAR